MLNNILATTFQIFLQYSFSFATNKLISPPHNFVMTNLKDSYLS